VSRPHGLPDCHPGVASTTHALDPLMSNERCVMGISLVGVVFSQHLGLLLEQLGQQHLGCFVRTATS
jgi:hypothetical protein